MKKFIVSFITILVLIGCFAIIQPSASTDTYDEEATITGLYNLYRDAYTQGKEGSTPCDYMRDSIHGILANHPDPEFKQLASFMSNLIYASCMEGQRGAPFMSQAEFKAGVQKALHQ